MQANSTLNTTLNQTTDALKRQKTEANVPNDDNIDFDNIDDEEELWPDQQNKESHVP